MGTRCEVGDGEKGLEVWSGCTLVAVGVEGGVAMVMRQRGEEGGGNRGEGGREAGERRRMKSRG